jgi:hypothetical protein
MDVAVSRAVSPPTIDRVNKPAVEQVFHLETPEKPQGVEADVARIFAKRAFQASAAGSSRAPVAAKGDPRGQTLNIHA